jgi:putative glutamine amidotransferase
MPKSVAAILGSILAVTVLAGPVSSPAAIATEEQAASAPPRVGMSGYVLLPDPEKGRKLGGYRVTRTYRDALVRAGAMPVHLLPVATEHVAALLDGLDGLVLCGGPDLDPAVYGEAPHPTVKTMPDERQGFDLDLARAALQAGMPVLGICLGAQELNVVRGGSLIQDIPSEVGTSVPHRELDIADLRQGVHTIEFVAGTRIAALYDAPTIRVNSAHHQAVDRLGQGLVVAARAPDGVIEAWEAPAHRFLVGVQFHPELQTSPPGQHDRLFAVFVEACAAYRAERAVVGSR